jgi:hypothetical protein
MWVPTSSSGLTSGCCYCRDDTIAPESPVDRVATEFFQSLEFPMFISRVGSQSTDMITLPSLGYETIHRIEDGHFLLLHGSHLTLTFLLELSGKFGFVFIDNELITTLQ